MLGRTSPAASPAASPFSSPQKSPLPPPSPAHETECVGNSCFAFGFLGFGGVSDNAGGKEAEDSETLIDSIVTMSKVLPDYSERVLPQLETLLDKHGIEVVIYLPTSKRNRPIGKKCVIRSKKGEARVEFRVRTGGEMKKMRFNWSEVEKIGVVPQAPQATENDCFMFMQITDRGSVTLQFESKSLRDATLMGFRLLSKKREGKLS